MSEHGYMARNSEIAQIHTYEKEKVLAGEFKNVRVYLTSKNDGGLRKWSDTKLVGSLRVVLLEHVRVPIAAVRVNSVAPNGLERGVIFEYELPLNFKFDPDLTGTFSALQTHL